MLSDRIKQLAENYVEARKGQKQTDDGEKPDRHTSKAYAQFVRQLDAENIKYFDREDADRIAAGIVEGSFDALYHTCGYAIILDSQTFRIRHGDLAGHTIESCPQCGRELNAYDLYAEPGGETRNLLRQAGLYPTSDSLVLMRDLERRAAILEELQGMLDRLSDGDLMTIYAVVDALLRENGPD